MRNQIARQTILVLPAWLFLFNFNTATACELHTNCASPHFSAGKGMESCSVFSPEWLGKVFTPHSPEGVSFANTGCSPMGHAVPLPATHHAYRIKKVVLDAGHGGKDPGCKGASSHEKHNALAIVLKLGALIREEYPDVEVIYTRETDVFVELNERAAIANRHNADLFISVHCNSIPVSYVKGVETYVMGLHTAQSNLEVAKRENASIFLEDNYKKNYGDYDPNSPEAHIFGSVWQSAYLEQSILFAGFVQQFSKEMARREDRGVKQAGFIVLHKTAMPAVLVEAGFLTNRDEERFIASEEGQFQMADAVFEAFRAYKAKMENTPLAARKHTTKAQMAAKMPASIPEPAAVPASSTPLLQEQPTETAKVQNVSATTVVNAPPARTGDRFADEPATIPAAPATKAAPETFRIHLLAWQSRMDRNSGQLGLLSGVAEEHADGLFHYFFGNYATRTDAEKMLPELMNLGFRTARVVSSDPKKN